MLEHVIAASLNTFITRCGHKKIPEH